MVEQERVTSFYPFRTGIRMEESINTLRREPDIILTPEEEAEIREFELTLTTGKGLVVGPNSELEESPDSDVEGIEHCWRPKIHQYYFHLEYFLTPKGIQDLERISETALPQFETVEDVKSFLFSFDIRNKDVETLKKISGNSTKHGENMVAEAIQNGEPPVNPTQILIVQNPEVFVGKIAQYRKLKLFHKKMAGHLNSGSVHQTNRERAMEIMLNIHRRRLNELLAANYDGAYAIVEQYMNGGAHLQTEAEQIQELFPRILSKEDSSTKARNLSRIDKFRYGVADLDSEAEYSVLSDQALDLADANDLTDNLILRAARWIIRALRERWRPDYIFKGIPRKKLENVTIDAETWIRWTKKALDYYGHLSQFEDYNPERSTRAPDGKWQVVTDPELDNLKIEAKQAVIKVPPSYKVKIAQIYPAGAVPVIDHEVAHIIQREKEPLTGLAIAQSNVGTDRSSVTKEAGAIAWERECQEKLFGNSRPTNPHYLRAIQARIEGGTYFDCVRAFYESMMRQDPRRDPKSTAQKSANRARRLFRMGGNLSDTSGYVYNTRALLYLEQELLAQAVSEVGLSRFLMVGSYSLRTLADLQRIGFINQEKIPIPNKRPSEILLGDINAEIERQLDSTYLDVQTAAQ